MAPTPGTDMTHHCAGCLRSTRHPWIEDRWVCRICQREVHPNPLPEQLLPGDSLVTVTGEDPIDRCPNCGLEMMAGASGVMCIGCNRVSPPHA